MSSRSWRGSAADYYCNRIAHNSAWYWRRMQYSTPISQSKRRRRDISYWHTWSALHFAISKDRIATSLLFALETPGVYHQIDSSPSFTGSAFGSFGPYWKVSTRPNKPVSRENILEKNNVYCLEEFPRVTTRTPFDHTLVIVPSTLSAE